ncbi:MAG: DNA-primase RepB domain-containing protein [Burkholderiaceae bacterium]
MSIALSQVLQRVFVRDPNTGENIWLPERVHAVLRVIFDMVLDDAPERPVAIFVQEIGRRCRKNVRTVQTALKEAEALGIIKRHRINVGRRWHGAAPEREIGATWPISVHWAAIEASNASAPHSGEPIVYPQPWAKPEGFGGATFAGANTAGKKGAGKDHYPPELVAQPSSSARVTGKRRSRAKPMGLVSTAADPAGLALPSVACDRGDSETVEQPIEDDSMNEDIERGPRGRAKSLAALHAFGRPQHGAQDVPAATDARYWTWLAASAAAAGWKEKTEGAWAGARAGDLTFSIQRRGAGGTKRGGGFPNQVLIASLSEAVACCTTQLARAIRWWADDAARCKNGGLEVVFQPLGDHSLLLIDDIKPEHLRLFDGWGGVAILETSPSNLQASIMAPRVLRHDETLAVQRALARRCGLTLAAVQQRQPRRVPGSVNNKLALSAPFITRLFCEPVAGTITVDQLAELLAEDKAYAAAVLAGTVVEINVARQATTVAGAAVAKIKPNRVGGGTDYSGSGDDWRWLKDRMGRVGGRDRDRLVAELEARARDRHRQEKSPGDPDHLRYAEVTVKKAFALAAAKKVA